ncbi:Arc family DNA-binding protein [Pluralibacter sp.]|uniref:Arc family DNA-binding protein n=1 Tax=Pluralibacter sp. TaxID=1920032 RepID=UPI0025CF9CD6|nr:Arc family DNA-binding protein [Pluralibacter sp.]MBV8045070.1 Arc family DNA-binding protein [Pluralibacter sp.]
MSREDPQLRIRLPIELKDKIESVSKTNNRSMNAEIVSILSDFFNREEQYRNSMVVVLGWELMNKHPEVREAFYNLAAAMAGAGNDHD